MFKSLFMYCILTNISDDFFAVFLREAISIGGMFQQCVKTTAGTQFHDDDLVLASQLMKHNTIYK